MRVSLFGKNSDSIRHLIPKFNLEFDDNQPQVLISYGGDGTLLSAERKYPSLAKLPIRDSKVCKKCPNHSTETLLKALSQNQILFQEYPKLESKYNSNEILAINDIVIRNSTPMHALRFTVFKNKEKLKPNVIIGDGIVVTTPFGSSGYYQSITRTTIDSGYAIAFNNTTQPIDPLKFTGDDQIRLVVVRGPGSLSSDNSSRIYYLKEGDEVQIFPSLHKAHIFMDTLRCTSCTILRDKRLH